MRFGKEIHLWMYVHIGGEYSVSDKFIVGVFDFDGTTGPGSETIRFLKRAEMEDKIEVISQDLPRSFIVTLERVYLSPISAATIRHRLEKARIGQTPSFWIHDDKQMKEDTDNHEDT